jgi:hypothetical protein
MKTYKPRKYRNCLIVNCPNTTFNGGRGLCKFHLRDATHRVKIGLWTWKGCEEMGLCLPPSRPPTKFKNGEKNEVIM